MKAGGKDWVLITGASSGIGLELCKVFAENDHNLVIVARNFNKLKAMALQLTEKYNAEIKIIAKDLSKQGAPKEIYDQVMQWGIGIDILVNNAGSGNCGLFHETDYSKDIEVLQLNIAALTLLTKFFARQMINAGRGKILNVASTGAYQPGPYIAVYYASKTYVLSFSEAIENELKPYGIIVSVLCPGAVKTEFSRRAGKLDLKRAMNPKDVANAAYIGLKKNKKLIIPGLANKIAIVISKILPGRLTAKAVRKIQQNLTVKYNYRSRKER